MYEAHFGLRQRPFRSTPDPGCYYPAAAHEAALHLLLGALADDEGFALLTGEPGSGKTLMAAILIDRLAEKSQCVFVTNGHMSRPVDLFQAVLYDLGLPYEGKREQELRLTLTDRLLTRYAEGQRTVLVFDEAHHLPPEVLEELRLLGNLETRLGRAVQVVLVGQPSLLEALQRPELRALAQRIAARASLDRLPREEAADYVLHHLRLAGARPEALLSDEAIDLIARATGGLPRLLNQATHLALALTCQAEAGRVDAEGALESLSRLGLEVEETDEAEAVPEPAAEDEPAPQALATATVVIEPQGADDHAWPPATYLRPGQPPRMAYVPGRSG
jgi:type II secretory pathway predicted ATPase ExeA